jgi:predicted enzyme related to lactoylglutathione lyase
MPTDPLEVLTGTGTPRRPGVHLAVELKRRLERELGFPPAPARPPMRTIGGQVGIVYLPTTDADRTFAFYSQLFGWESDAFRDGTRTAHYVINTATLTVITEDPGHVGLFFPVADLHDALALVEGAGGTVTETAIRPDGSGFAGARDNQGFAFGLWRPDGLHQGPAPTRMPTGEVGYLTIDVPDLGLARLFYQAVLGWEAEPSHPFLTDTELPVDLRAVDGPPRVHLFFRVPDIAATCDAVRALGGAAAEPVAAGRAGASAECTDDQGQPLTLWEPAAGF